MHRLLLGLLLALAPLCDTRAQPLERLATPYVQGNAIYWDLDTAIEKGFFRDEGFAPEITLSQSSVQSIQVMISGGAELTVSQPEAVLSALLRGGEGFAIIAAPASRPDWVLAVQPEIKEWDDLKGKVLGFGGFKVGEYWLTVKLLNAHGVTPKDYSAIEIGTSGPRFAALLRKSIAGAVLFQPTGQQAAQMGLTIFHRFSEDVAAPPIVYTVARKWAEAAQHGQRVARALIRAHAWLYDPANRGESIAILQKYTKRDAATIDPVYDLYVGEGKILSEGAIVEIAGLKSVLAVMAENGAVPAGTGLSPEQYLLPRELGGLYR